jgi:hypothetical protein
VVAVLLGSPRALARPADVRFEWQRQATSLCPTRAVLQADVEAVLGRRVFSAGPEPRVIIRGEADDALKGVTVRLEAIDMRGEPLGSRELAAPAGECASLREAIVLVLTLFVEYDGKPESEVKLVLGFGAEGTLAQAPMPRIALAMGPALWLAIGSVLRLRVRGAYWPPVSIETARGVGTSVEAFSLQLGACARVWKGMGVCASGEGGALIATPHELQGPPRQARLLAHGVLGATWELALVGALHAELGAGAQLSFSRPPFSYTRADGTRMAVYRPQAVGAILHVSIIILDE